MFKMNNESLSAANAFEWSRISTALIKSFVKIVVDAPKLDAEVAVAREGREFSRARISECFEELL